MAIAGATTCEVTEAVESARDEQVAAPARAPACVPAIDAWTCADRRLIAITASIAMFLESLIVAGVKDVAADSISASISASETACTRTAPAASIVVADTLATVLAGSSVLRMSAPEIAASVLKRMLFGAQPIELKASVTPIARPGERGLGAVARLDRRRVGRGDRDVARGRPERAVGDGRLGAAEHDVGRDLEGDAVGLALGERAAAAGLGDDVAGGADRRGLERVDGERAGGRRRSCR